jgi:hypothetical protein
MDHREVIQEGRLHRLVINKTIARDAGIYKCTVKNQTTESKVTVKGIKLDKLCIIVSICLELAVQFHLYQLYCKGFLRFALKVLKTCNVGEQTYICAYTYLLS